MLEKIKDKQCPTCGTQHIVSELRDDQGGTGLWNERRRFSCGCMLYFSSSSRKVLVEKECVKSDRAIKLKQELEKTKADLDKVLAKSNLSDKMKQQIKEFGWLGVYKV